MVINVGKNPILKALPTKQITVAEFDEGQITEYENDKIPFSACSVLQNMVLRKKNLETRRGYTTIKSDSAVVGLCKMNNTSDPLLGVFNAGTTTTSLSSLNPLTGVKTSLIAAATGIQKPSWCNSNNKFYFTVGNGEIHSYDIDTSTAAIPLTLTGVKAVTFSDKRVWAATNDEVHYSTTAIDSFSDALGSYDATTGLYDNGLTHGGKVSLGSMSNLVTVVADGKTVIVFSRDRLQAHILPDADFVSFIDKDRVTMQYEKDYGIDSPRAVLVRGGYIYFVNKDGFYRLNPRSGEVKVITKNKTQHQSFNYENAALGYDKELAAILISCQNNAANDTIIAYFEDYDAFSYYTNISANELVSIEDALYSYNRSGVKIYSLFPENQWTDDGVPITYKAVTAVTDTGTPQYYKKMNELFIDIASEGTRDIEINMYFDRISGGNKAAGATFTITWDALTNTFGVLAGHPVGDAPLGMTSISDATGVQEIQKLFKNRTQFGRVEIEVTGTAVKRVSWRRFVFEYQRLPKKIKSILLSS